MGKKRFVIIGGTDFYDLYNDVPADTELLFINSEFQNGCIHTYKSERLQLQLTPSQGVSNVEH